MATELERLRLLLFGNIGIEMRCSELLKQFGDAGLTRARAIQAIKTDRVSELSEKWRGKKSSKANNKKKEMING